MTRWFPFARNFGPGKLAAVPSACSAGALGAWLTIINIDAQVQDLHEVARVGTTFPQLEELSCGGQHVQRRAAVATTYP